MPFYVFLSQALGCQNSHHHLQIPGVKSSQLSCDLLPKTLDSLLATSAHSAMLLLQKWQYFPQFEDKVKYITLSFKITALFQKHIFQATTLFPSCNRIQHKNITKNKVRQSLWKDYMIFY